MGLLEKNLKNRAWLIERLKAEIIGPDPTQASDALAIKLPDTTDKPRLASDEALFSFTWEDFGKAKIQPNGEEILWQDPPLRRYGAGMLFPQNFTEKEAMEEDANQESPEEEEKHFDDDNVGNRKSTNRKALDSDADESEDYDVTLSNAYRPSAMGLSFLADLSQVSEGIQIRVEYAKYQPFTYQIKGTNPSQKDFKSTLWFRVPGTDADGNTPVVLFTAAELLQQKQPLKKLVPGPLSSNLYVSIVSRSIGQGGEKDYRRILTVCLVNDSKYSTQQADKQTFFQCGMEIQCTADIEWILPYPDSQFHDPTEEDQVARLLYRDRKTFAIGHGCSSQWEGKNKQRHPSKACRLWTECMPTYEIASISPNIKDQEGNLIRISMRKLAGLDSSDDGFGELAHLLDAYGVWISVLEQIDNPKPLQKNFNRASIPDELKPTAKQLVKRCKKCLTRMKEGLHFLQKNPAAMTAFRLMNEAMLIAQLKRNLDKRSYIWSDVKNRCEWNKTFPTFDLSSSDPIKGYWRPFQIAFLLMSIRGICEPDHAERDIVDLIWFPTGGGKTEAYLGLTAFTLFFNRLAGNRSGGVEVIMRYTLRLLTTQQFERAGLLFCCMEYIRKKYLSNMESLGKKPFRLGMWVGSSTAPNTHESAIDHYKNLCNKPGAENPFVLLHCPWCGASMRPNETKKPKPNPKKAQTTGIMGYQYCLVPGSRRRGIFFRCPDNRCAFNQQQSLPITVIDEEIYNNPPSMLIGTVDKFGLLSWNPKVRTLFGIAANGERNGIPPSLIIQDELHLISGPLGSMTGVFETLIETLCRGETDEGNIVHPKIIASTATISRAEEQILALYARRNVDVFPPSGLEADDSFFAREEKDEGGNLKPGRIYAGVLAPGYGSSQITQERVYAALLQYPAVMPVADESEKDPWWTLLCFFNSLRELGGAATIFQSETRAYLKVLRKRHGLEWETIRKLHNVIELTSRIKSEQVPESIQELEIEYGEKAVDVCLASNIIEAGIDINRLGLMVVIGQPKTTSQYIQVSSRVGRDINAPGLVVTVFSAAKPRDRSHYERFRSYHQSLYAQVEPTSVTPFSPPVVDRALHTFVVGIVRQLGTEWMSETPRPFPFSEEKELRYLVEEVLLKRVEIVDPNEKAYVNKKLQVRLKEWEVWDPSEYGGFGSPPENAPLLYPAGSFPREEWNERGWPTPVSLRNVDATCSGEITEHYNIVQREEDNE